VDFVSYNEVMICESILGVAHGNKETNVTLSLLRTTSTIEK
jgi:hypothetical protein